MMLCQICNREVNNFNSLRNHIRFSHKEMTTKLYYDTFMKKDNEGLCVACTNITVFDGLKQGYRQFCSVSCSSKYCNSLDSIKQKIKATKLDRYGDSTYNNMAKCKSTLKEKYGDERYVNIEGIKQNWANKTDDELKLITQKIKSTKLIKYGDENYRNGDKIMETKLKKYNDANYTNIDKIKKSLVEHYDNHRAQFITDKLTTKQLPVKINAVTKQEYNLHCDVCDKDFNIKSQEFYLRYTNNEIICNICNEYHSKTSKPQKMLIQFIKENYTGIVIENANNIISPYELDIYLPELKLAFEFNGLYWHSELFVESKYHLTKTELCEKQGIHLVHIYEDQWDFKEEIVKSRILNLIGQSKKIYARKTICRVIKCDETRPFIEANHIQGFIASAIALGLYQYDRIEDGIIYGQELVAVMTFGKLRKNLGQKSVDGSYELLRFCNKKGTTVVGGANKLYKYFIEHYNPVHVTSYADRGWTMHNGNSLYDKLNMKMVSISLPSYFYIVDGHRKNRFGYRKDVLISQGFDGTKTEHEIMIDRNIYRIYDSGCLKYVYEK